MSIFANKKDLEAAQSQIESLSADLSTAQADLAAERETVTAQAQTIVDLQGQVAAVTAERDAAQSQATALEADLAEANSSAEARAAEIVAQAGIAPVDTSAEEVDSQSIFNHYQTLKKTKPSEATAFWNANKEQIIKQSQL